MRSISSSDYQFFLSIIPETAAVISAAVWGLVCAYDKLLDIRLKRKELSEQEAPEAVTSEIDKWAEKIMSDSVNEITAELVKEFKTVKRPSGRANELKTAIRMSLKKVAGRLDVGYHFSIRVGDAPEPENEDDEEFTEKSSRKTEIVQAIRRDGSRIEFRDLPGDPVLPLDWQPNPDDTAEDE